MKRSPGSSLIEMVLALGVLAVALPLGLGAIRQAGDGLRLAREDGQSVAMVHEVLEELKRAREGRPCMLGDIGKNADFPSSGHVLGLAFDGHGRMLRKIGNEEYRDGSPAKAEPRVTHFAIIEGRANGARRLSDIEILIEFPASAKQGTRQSLAYHTQLR